MKKLFALAVVAFLLGTVTNTQAQLRNVKNSQYISNTDAAGNDTLYLTPHEYETVVKHTLTDSTTYKIKSSAGSIFGDQIKFVVKNTSGGVKFKLIPATGGFQVTGADSVMAPTASKGAVQIFIFDGTNFVEQSKIVR